MRENYDISYCDPITAYQDPHCSHQDTVPYDYRAKHGTVIAMREVCTNCGKISTWGEAKKHTVTKQFQYAVSF